MKHLLILSLVALFTCKAAAQQRATRDDSVNQQIHRTAKPIVIPPAIIQIKEVPQYLGKQVRVYGKVINYRLAYGKVRYIKVQDKGKHSTVNLLITGSNVKIKANHLKGSYFDFIGKVVAVKGTPEILVNDVEQVDL
jgi:hypothetical protein